MEPATLIILGAAFLLWTLTMLALIDVILKDFGSLKSKFIWIIVASIPGIGWLVYLIFGFKKGVRRNSGA